MLDKTIHSGIWVKVANVRNRKNEIIHGLIGFVIDGALVYNTLLFYEDGKVLRSEYIDPKDMIVIDAPSWGEGFRAIEIPSVDWMGGINYDAVYDPQRNLIIQCDGGGDFTLKASTVLWRLQRGATYLKRQMAA